MDLTELYQDLIIDHGTEPRNHCCMPDPSCTAEGFNPTCGDKVIVYIKLQDYKIEKITFTGQGCAISMASASIMTQILHDLSIMQAKHVFTNFKNLVTTDPTTANFDFGKLAALSGVRKFPSRIKCATLAWHTMLSAINGYEEASKNSEFIINNKST